MEYRAYEKSLEKRSCETYVSVTLAIEEESKERRGVSVYMRTGLNRESERRIRGLRIARGLESGPGGSRVCPL